MNKQSADNIFVKNAFWIWRKKCLERSLKIEQDIFIDERPSVRSETKNDFKKQEEKGAFSTNKPVKQKWKPTFNWHLPSSIDPETNSLYFFWQFFSSLSLLYNAFVIPLRCSFPYQTAKNQYIWFTIDCIADITYLFDIILFQRRRQYLERGCMIVDSGKIKKFYYKSNRFKRDVMSIIPFDFLYFFTGFKPIFRFNRLFKTDSYIEFNNLFEMMLKQAHIFRVVRTTAYLLYVIHLDACLYFGISYLKNFSSPWGYNLEGVAYIRCFFWAFMNITTIGNVPDPFSTTEYILQLIHYFLGLFIFSIVIGQVRDSIQAASAEFETYRTKKNACINFLQKNNIPVQVQRKVRLWFEYTWNTQRILDEHALLMQMPGKMHTEIAINVHMDVLSKVEIFKECDRHLLYDLLVKLRPVLYLPGEYVCKKGEVGREMYIITNGLVQVVGQSPTQIFATLHPGTAFGEISLLAIGGGNRRTANIYSPGFTTVFILYKQDLNAVLVNYPDAQAILKKKAQKILNKDKQQKACVAHPSPILKMHQKTNLGNEVIKILACKFKLQNVNN